MKTAMTRRLLLLAPVSAPAYLMASHKGAGSVEVARREVEQTFDRYVQGWNQGSVEILSGIYAHDATLSAYWPDPSTPTVEGWDTVKRDLEDIFRRIHGMALDFTERKVEVYGDVAVLTTIWTWKEAPSPMFEHGRASFIFQRRNRNWVVVHEHSSIQPFLPNQDKGEESRTDEHSSASSSS